MLRVLGVQTFQSTLPARGATSCHPSAGERRAISIHAPRTGSDGTIHRCVFVQTHFNPRSPHGERRDYANDIVFQLIFQSTLPARGATRCRRQCRRSRGISIHAPRTGSDRTQLCYLYPTQNFNPRSPHGERHDRLHRGRSREPFQSTLPARGATAPASGRGRRCSDFNPRSPHGERLARGYQINPATIFQSTLPARGATYSAPCGARI